jgi:decaprenyl-phosphate phosphoribosyltransferase
MKYMTDCKQRLQQRRKLIREEYTIPLVLFGLFRYWYIACSSEQGGSPTDVLLHDRPLLGVVLLWSLMVLYLYW